MLGIETLRVYGRRHPEEGRGMLYDTVPLLQALSAILGKRLRPETRRNTIDSVNTGV